MIQQQQTTAQTIILQREKTEARFDDFVIVAFDCLSLYEFHHAVDYPEQPHRDTLPWIIKSGRFEVLQYKNGDAIVLANGEPYPMPGKQKKTTFRHTIKRSVSDLLFWVSVFHKAGNGFTPKSIFMNIFPWLDYETA